MNNLDMNAIMKMLSKMDKKDLEVGLAKAQEILKQKGVENNNNNSKKQFYNLFFRLQII